MHSLPVMTIGIISFYLEIHPSTIRRYEKFGLIKPFKLKCGKRLYSLNDFYRIEIIIYLTREKSCKLSKVKSILSILDKYNVKPVDFGKFI